LAAQGVDQKAGDTLRSQSEEIIRKILGEGVMAGRNPSALLMARIRQLTTESGLGGDDWDHAPWRSSKDSMELESFVKEAGLDGAAEEALRAQSEDVQRKIMSEDVVKCRNPSAMVMKLIRTTSSDADVQYEPPAKKARTGGGEKPRAGGGDVHQPISSRVCRHFQKGRCNYGDKCSFRHEEGAGPDQSADEGGLLGEAEKELSEALEELHTAAWDRGLPQEDFEAMMRRVSDAREQLVEAGLADEAEAASRQQDDEQDSGADPPPSPRRKRTPGSDEELDAEGRNEDMDGRGEAEDDADQPPAKKNVRAAPPRPSIAPSASAAAGGE